MALFIANLTRNPSIINSYFEGIAGQASNEKFNIYR
jgi:hypothetical protein